jgi:hypothetical protein
VVLAVHVGQVRLLNDAQHQVSQDSRILHNVCPRPVVALRIRGDIAHIELDGGDAAVELVVKAGLDEAAEALW